jgi:hypothetical protein
MKYLSFLALLTVISCSNGEVTRQPLEGNLPYTTSGVEQFFLPQLPNWSNYSMPGKCFKSSSFQYLDFPKLQRVYQLSYSQMIELQSLYNERLENYFRSTAVRFLKPVEEANLFSNTLEQIRAGVRQLNIPNVKELEVIWLEHFINQNKVEAFKKMVKEGRFDEKLPIIFSSCFSKQRLNQWLIEQGLEDMDFRTVTAEWLNPYGSSMELQPGLRVEIAKLLGENMKIFFLPENKELTPELVLP